MFCSSFCYRKYVVSNLYGNGMILLFVVSNGLNIDGIRNSNGIIAAVLCILHFISTINSISLLSPRKIHIFSHFTPYFAEKYHFFHRTSNPTRRIYHDNNRTLNIERFDFIVYQNILFSIIKKSNVPSNRYASDFYIGYILMLADFYLNQRPHTNSVSIWKYGNHCHLPSFESDSKNVCLNHLVFICMTNICSCPDSCNLMERDTCVFCSPLN